LASALTCIENFLLSLAEHAKNRKAEYPRCNYFAFDENLKISIAYSLKGIPG
jgi:hypothetical protein